MLKVLDRVGGFELLDEGRFKFVEYTEDEVDGVLFVIRGIGWACDCRFL